MVGYVQSVVEDKVLEGVTSCVVIWTVEGAVTVAVNAEEYREPFFVAILIRSVNHWGVTVSVMSRYTLARSFCLPWIRARATAQSRLHHASIEFSPRPRLATIPALGPGCPGWVFLSEMMVVPLGMPVILPAVWCGSVIRLTD